MSNYSTRNADFRELMQAYAIAMWTWAELEASIFQIYLAAVGGADADLDPLHASFFAIHSAEMRLLLTHAAVKRKWPKHPLFDRWTALYDECITAAGERGRIAHKIGRQFSPQKPHQTELTVLVEPAWHPQSPDKWGVAKSTGLTATALRTFQAKWSSLITEINKLSGALFAETLPPKSSLQRAGRARPAQTRAEVPIPTKLSSLRRPSRG